MALKFLNKKGWHTGSLRNIENVWKAEQKHNAEQAKLEELRKQIQEEREKSEFRQLQEQAGLVPRQERLDFLYESGLAVGKSSEGFKALESPQAPAVAASASAEAGSSKAAVPGALFEDKPQTANDAWRKLHSDPLLLIRQREQDALARIKNNPVQMAMIRKSVEAEKKHKVDKGKREKKHKRKRHHKLKSGSENTSGSEEDRRKRNRLTSDTQKHSKRKHSSKDSSDDEERSDHIASERRKDSSSKHEKHSSRVRSDARYSSASEDDRRKSHKESNLKYERHSSRARIDARHSSRTRSDSSESEGDRKKGSHSTYDHRRQNSHTRHPSRHPERDEEGSKYVPSASEHHHPISEPGDGNNMSKEARTQSLQGPGYNRRKGVPKMTEEEREARLREMQLDAELHEEQRWKRIKKAAEADSREAVRGSSSGGKNFLEDAQKSIYGAEKGGSTTIEESVRRRAYYSQGGTAAHESNAFRR